MAEFNFPSLINLINEEFKRGMTDESMKHLGGISDELESLSVFLSGWNCDAGDVPRKRKGEKDQHRD